MFYGIWILAWRYFTGLHLDGRLRKNARNGSVLPRYSSYFWNRYSRKRRALWRHVAFWGTLATGYGLVVNRGLTVFAVMCFCPFVLFVLARKGLDMVTIVVTFTDSDGVKSPYRIMRPQIRSWFARHRPARVRITLPDGGPVEPTVERAILAENAEDHGEPILNMRVAKALEGQSGPRRPKRNPYKRKSS